MKISVIIPTHNEEEHIAEALKAILKQDYPSFEVIVVDNASTDRTAEIVRQFPVNLVSEWRQGTLRACESGRAEATGDIIARMDADCLPDYDWLSRGAKHFEKKEIVAASGPYDYYDASLFFNKTSLLAQRYVYKFFSYLLQLPFIKRGAVMIGGNSLMRADVLAKAGGFNTSITFYGDDTDTARRVAKHGKVIFDPNLIIKTSARRFKKEGVLALQAKYIYHFLKALY
jgi:glycosyltransferase involved in cell wall biosynthesis